MTRLEIIKQYATKHHIYISTHLEFLGSDEWEWAYTIQYLPKEHWQEKRRSQFFHTYESFKHWGGATYIGAWSSYDECLKEAINKAGTFVKDEVAAGQQVFNGTFNLVGGGTEFTCSTSGISFEEVENGLIRLRDEINRQIMNKDKCPYSNETKVIINKPGNM